VAGFYRGGHSQTTDNRCLPCHYNDTLLNSQSLHVADTHGLEYDNAYSCSARCLGHSRLRDARRPWLGCVSCEVGNVLLKVFPEDMGAARSCEFACRACHERVALADSTFDCFLAQLQPSARSEFSHSVAVGDYAWQRGVLALRILHPCHCSFGIVVGGVAPADCKRGALSRHCCYAVHWRVSTLAQLGLEADDGCRGRAGLLAEPESSRAGLQQLVFAVPDAQLAMVARCSWQGEQRRCVLWVLLVDTITWHVVSASVELRTTRAVTLAFAPGAGRASQMLPLTVFDVQVSLWRTLPAGEHVFELRCMAQGSAMTVTTRVLRMEQLGADAARASRWVVRASRALIRSCSRARTWS